MSYQSEVIEPCLSGHPAPLTGQRQEAVQPMGAGAAEWGQLSRKWSGSLRGGQEHRAQATPRSPLSPDHSHICGQLWAREAYKPQGEFLSDDGNVHCHR